MSGESLSPYLRYFCSQMRKSFFNLGFLGLIGLFFLGSCSTDFDVNAPFEETPIVYAVFNPDSLIHIVRINRGFQNRDGRDARTIAKENADSSNLRSGVYDVFMLRETRVFNRTVLERVNFKDTIITGKSSDGDFTNANYLSFKTNRKVDFQYDSDRAPSDQRWRNQVVQLFIVNRSTKDTIKASTRLIGDFEAQNPENRFPRAAFFFNPSPTFQRSGPELQFTVPCWANSYKTNLDFKVREIYTNGDSSDYIINWESATSIEATFPGCGTSEVRNGRVAASGFFALLKDAVKTRGNDDRIKARKLVSGTAYFYAATDNLTRYITVANNFSPITQSVPVYSNIAGGLGVFGSIRMVSAPFVINQEMVELMNELLRPDVPVYPDLYNLKFVVHP